MQLSAIGKWGVFTCFLTWEKCDHSWTRSLICVPLTPTDNVAEQVSRCFLLPPQWKHAVHTFVHWSTTQWIFAIRHHVSWEQTCILRKAAVLKRWFQELASCSGLLVHSTSSLNKGAKSFQGLLGFTSNYWSCKGSMLPKNVELWKELREPCSSSAWALTIQGGRRKSSASHNHRLTSGSSLRHNHCLKAECWLCHFPHFTFFLKVPRNFRNKSVWKSIPFLQSELGVLFVCFVCF